MASSIPYRICNRCHQSFALTSEFWHKDRDSPSGFHYTCKECARTRAHEYYARNSETARLRQMEYRRDPDIHRRIRERERIRNQRPEVREANRQYRRANAAKVKVWRAKSQRRNRAAANLGNWRYRQTENGKIKNRQHSAKRRALKRAAGGECSAEDIQLQLRNQTDRKGVARCWWCNKPLGDERSLDHRIPLSRGGTNDARNIVITHLKCNLSKNDKLPQEYNGRLL